MQGVFRVCVTLARSSVCPSPLLGRGFYSCLFWGFFWCLVFFLLHGSWQALISVAVGQRERSGAARKGGDSAWLVPKRTVLHPVPVPHPPCTVLGAQGAAPPRLCPPLSWVCSVPLLACAAYIGPVATWSFMKSGRVEAGGHGGHCWEGRRPVSGSMPVSVPAPGWPGRGPLTLEQSLGSPL